MRYITVVFLFVFILVFSLQCTTSKNTLEKIIYTDNQIDQTGLDITIDLKTGEGFNHPTYVIWMEDMYGNFLQTLFITQSYASGIFGYEMVGDSIWLPRKGASYQPAALPYWTHKKGMIDGADLIPTPANPYLDGYTGATPKGDLSFKTTIDKNLPVRILCEYNQAWDWDKYWTNAKYPGNDAYEHSAQPSLIYATTLNKDDNEFFLNPIGHGDPKGESGKLFTNLNTLSSAKEIFETISIKLNK